MFPFRGTRSLPLQLSVLLESREQTSLTVYLHCGCPRHTGAHIEWVEFIRSANIYAKLDQGGPALLVKDSRCIKYGRNRRGGVILYRGAGQGLLCLPKTSDLNVPRGPLRAWCTTSRLETWEGKERKQKKGNLDPLQAAGMRPLSRCWGLRTVPPHPPLLLREVEGLSLGY